MQLCLWFRYRLFLCIFYLFFLAFSVVPSVPVLLPPSYASPVGFKFSIVIYLSFVSSVVSCLFSNTCALFTIETLHLLTEMFKQSCTHMHQLCAAQGCALTNTQTKQTRGSNWHSAREQRHNRPETIKHREEMGPLVRDIYIIEKDFEGNSGSCMPRKHTRLPASLPDMPNNDLSTLSLSLSPWSLFFCLPLCHVSLPLSLPLLHVPAGIIQITI